MPPYAAFLGHQPRISTAELAATIPDFSLEHMVGNNIAHFETKQELSQKNLHQWGGIVILAKKIGGANVSI